MRQLFGQSGRVCVAQGEAMRYLISDAAIGLPSEHQNTGLAKLTAGQVAYWRRCLRDSDLGECQAVMTSSSQTARCGPACRVVSQVPSQ